jgi:hypothetical protein
LRHVNRQLAEIGVRCIQIGLPTAPHQIGAAAIGVPFSHFAAMQREAFRAIKNALRLTVLHKTVA